MPITAVRTAFAGMEAASLRLERAAAEIARLGQEPTPPEEAPGEGDPGLAAGSPLLYGRDGRFLTSPNPAEPVDLTAAMAEVLEARIAYMANAKVVKVANEMMDSLLDATA